MKFTKHFKNILITLTILCILSSSQVKSSFLDSFLGFLGKSNTENKVENTNSNEMEISTFSKGADFKDFVTEAHGHTIPGTGSCGNPSQCRTMNEVLYIAYKRSKMVKDLMKIKKVYIASVHPHMATDGVSKVVISAPSLLGISKNNVKGAPLFR
jgi:hypothetical protein